MTFTHALSTNNYGPAKFIVATSSSNGTHTTLASAMSAASVGDTIFLRDSVTENVTITPGVNIVGWTKDSLNVPSITGTLTMTGAGTSALSGLRLVTNSAPLITVSGSAASILYINNCYLNSSNNTGISYSSSSSSSQIVLDNCRGDIGTTGIGLYASTSPGQLAFNWCAFGNSGGSTTASTTSSGNVNIFSTFFSSPLSCSSTGNYTISNSNINTSAQNATSLTTAGTGTSYIEYSDFVAGTASAISIGAGTTINELAPCRIESSNTNAITGSGTIDYNMIVYSGSSSKNNATTQTPVSVQAGNIFQPQLNSEGVCYINSSQQLVNTTVGNSGQVLTSNGSGVAPTFQALPSNISKAVAFQFTYDISTASGTQNFTGLSFTPTAVCSFSATSGSAVTSNSGVDDGTHHYCSYIVSGTTSADTAHSLVVGTNGSNFQSGLISAFLSNGFTVTWVKTGTPTGTATISGIAFG